MTEYSFCDIILVEFPHSNFLKVSKRPALVIYDAGDIDIVVARITSQVYDTGSDYKISKWKESGLIFDSYIRLGKIATIEKRYISRRLGVLMYSEQNAVKKIMRVMFNL